MAAQVQGEALACAVLGLGALAFAGIGLAFLFAPQAMGHRVGLVLEDVAADNDVRAVYAGLQIACGLALARAARRPHGLRAALELQILLFSGRALREPRPRRRAHAPRARTPRG